MRTNPSIARGRRADVLLLLFDAAAELPAGVRACALAGEWTVGAVRTPRSTLDDVRALQPKLVVAQLSDEPLADGSLALLAALHRSRTAPLLVVPRRHTPEIETAAREIGAACYLPDGATASELERAVAQILARVSVTHCDAPTRPRHTRPPPRASPDFYERPPDCGVGPFSWFPSRCPERSERRPP